MCSNIPFPFYCVRVVREFGSDLSQNQNLIAKVSLNPVVRIMEVENTMQKLINVVCTNLKQFYNPAYSMFCVVYLSGKS